MVKVSRESIFNNSYFPGKYIYYQSNRPFSRGQATLSIVNNTIYLFGGMSNERLNDIWKCELQCKIIII